MWNGTNYLSRIFIILDSEWNDESIGIYFLFFNGFNNFIFCGHKIGSKWLQTFYVAIL